ncbi:hypothetical protein F8M41_005109 [Gigaspora margarita]|uniref:Uncharacterized protein n=1 Tax=Gigaspora margarita TaxID=4874 RepID=A0A8H3XA60_GIGMA|nr:hypothetical protein F8M41_005109 [Gigaspora margarita]
MSVLEWKNISGNLALAKTLHINTILSTVMEKIRETLHINTILSTVMEKIRETLHINTTLELSRNNFGIEEAIAEALYLNVTITHFDLS